MSTKVAFITGASRGIGAEAAVALARRGYRVAITARTLGDGEQHDHMGSDAPLPGSLEATAAAVRAAGGEALCLRADILDEQSVVDAALEATARFGAVDLLFNNAVYQGPGNQEPVLAVTREQLNCIYQGNVFTPLALVRTLLPGMLERGQGTIINMVSYTAFHNPPAAADQGGWSFGYPSSKAALARMAGALRVEHADSGLRFFNIEPGTVITEVMKAAGMTEELMARFKPCTPQAIAAVVAWLADNEPLAEWQPEQTLAAPAIAKQLDLLRVPSLLGE
ncbi:SDR family NAD(P)-dependent oxidoreductase [Seongchinamella unica]|uniref:SDR family NAD(P)-dependent oxidoreductase n=1 Tax=Seongchinamella unica TaxID=2547392 RepID=A0A4R5LSC9_9GAMM|nr:SDR family NAD(P)-dependent oxidoreductase [Seongchinamella unica]TDG13736.1 SDR family NAD(P)-dependent oxidoreductase [Seongchinamella unica]